MLTIAILWVASQTDLLVFGTGIAGSRLRELVVDGSRDALLAFYEGKIAKWWTPDDVVFVDGIPLGATGKMQKNKLREQLVDYKLPPA